MVKDKKNFNYGVKILLKYRESIFSNGKYAGNELFKVYAYRLPNKLTHLEAVKNYTFILTNNSNYMKLSFKTLLCTIVLFFAFATPNVKAQGLNADTIKAQLIKEWQRSKAYTFAYLNAMPADKYGFKAVDSIRSFAQQMLHLAAGQFFLVHNATGEQSPVMMMVDENRTGAQTKDSVMYYVGASYDFAINAIEKMDAARLGENVKGFNGPVTRLVYLMKCIEHQAHHRGQTTIYIRLQGIRPPNEQLF